VIVNKAAYLRVGLLLVGGVVAVVALVLFLGRGEVRGGVMYESYFRESVQGLEIGAPVKYRGVTLGQVKEIGLVSAKYLGGRTANLERATAQLVFVRYGVEPDRMGVLAHVNDAVALGLRARLASQGITGLAYLELDFVNPIKFPAETVPWTPEVEYIPSMPSTITQVQDAAQTLLARLEVVDIAGIAASLKTVLDDAHGELSSGDAHVALAELAVFMHSLQQGLDAADLPGLATDLRAATAALRGTLDGKDTRKLLSSSSQAADRLSAAAARLPALIDGMQATLKRIDAGAADIQADLVPVLRDTRAAVANLRDTSETLRRYPSSVLLGAPPQRGGGVAK